MYGLFSRSVEFDGMNPDNPQNPYQPAPNGQPPIAPQPSAGTPPPMVSGDIRPTPTSTPPPSPPVGTPVYDPYGPPAAPPPKKRRLRESWRSIGGTVFLLILAPVIALSITAFAFQSYQVDGASMETTLTDKDRLIVNKLPRTISKLTDNPYIPNRGEIIIFSTGGDSSGTPQKQLIKRVIGLPGETVIVTSGTVLVSNATQPEGFNPDEAGLYEIDAPTTPGEARFTLMEDELFVLGDNRTNSEDSRYIGPVKLDQVVGELAVRIMPLSQAQKF